jgi:holo-[acyl-carrier protein] synthase
MSFYGGNYCVKEAVSKALGTGFRGFGPLDVEVLREESGRPYVVLYGNARRLADELGVVNIYVSISNLKDLVSAVVIMEGSDTCSA